MATSLLLMVVFIYKQKPVRNGKVYKEVKYSNIQISISEYSDQIFKEIPLFRSPSKAWLSPIWVIVAPYGVIAVRVKLRACKGAKLGSDSSCE